MMIVYKVNIHAVKKRTSKLSVRVIPFIGGFLKSLRALIQKALVPQKPFDLLYIPYEHPLRSLVLRRPGSLLDININVL